MEDGMLLLVAKVIKKTLSNPSGRIGFTTINGEPCIYYYECPDDELNYIERGGNKYWSQYCPLTIDNLTYLLSAINAQED